MSGAAAAGAEQVIARVDAELSGDGAIDNNHNGWPRQRGGHVMQTECLGGKRLYRRNDHRHVLGLAARHHRIDGDLFRRQRDLA